MPGFLKFLLPVKLVCACAFVFTSEAIKTTHVK